MNHLTPPVDAARVFLIGLLALAVISTPAAAVSHPSAASQQPVTTTPDLASPITATHQASGSTSNISVHISIRHPSRHVLVVTKHIDFASSVETASVVTVASWWPSNATGSITAETTNVTNGHLTSSGTRVTWNGTGSLITQTRLQIPAFPIGVNALAILTKHGVIVTPWLTERGWYTRSKYPVQFTRTVSAPQNKSINGGGGLIYIGPFEKYTSTAPNETISLVVTGGAAKNMTPTPNAVLAAYRNESQLLPVGHRPKNLTVFVITDEARGGFAIGVGGNGHIILYPGANLNQTTKNGWRSLYNPWFHEYVHNRQITRRNRYGPKMQWYLEADANYYAALVTYNEHLGSFRSLWHTLNDTSWGNYGQPATATAGPLANRSQWPSPQYPYTRGPKVLALLDTQIREQTNGTASFLDVMRTMNRKAANGTTITLPVFEQILEAYLPEKMVQQDVNAYITGTQSVPISTRPAAYTLPPTPIDTSTPAPDPPAEYVVPSQQSTPINTSTPTPEPPAEDAVPPQQSTSSTPEDSGPVTMSGDWNGILTTLGAYEHRAAAFVKYHQVQSILALVIVIVWLVLRRLHQY